MQPQSFSVLVVRPQDLLLIKFEFRDVGLDPPQGSQDGQVVGLSNSYLIAHFQPQHVTEEAYYQATPNIQQTKEEQDAGKPPPPGNEFPEPPGQVGSRLAGTSWVAFVIPEGEKIAYTLGGLLGALTQLPLSVSPVSRYEPPGCFPLSLLFSGPPPPKIAPPAGTHTAIELPWRLYLSPDHQATWSHALRPVQRDDWTELWHTRLGSKRPDGDPRLRAIWSPDFLEFALQPFPTTPQPFRSSLDPRDRNELVHVTANYHIDNFRPSPVDTENLMLTTLGGWLKVQGDWLLSGQGPGDNALTVEQWRHVATVGRDHHVRVVYAGYLFPFGHRASLVKVTERKFYFREDAEVPGMIAYLFQRMFILVREPVRSYSHRAMPFRTVLLKTRVTPNLADPNDPAGQANPPGMGQESFWPRVVVGNQIVDFQFHLVGTDWDGNQVEFSAPLIFASLNVDKTKAADVVNYYEGLSATSARRARPLDGQDVAFAPSQMSGDTTFETITLSFGAQLKPNETPHFWPTLSQAGVDVPAVKQLLGKSVVSTIVWEDSYLQASGNNIGNAGQVFAKLDGATPLGFDTDKAGGLVGPSIDIGGLSRTLGPVGGPVNQMVSGDFKPQDIFGGGVKLLGGIELWEIIKDLVFSNAASAGDKLPRLTTERDGDVLRTRYRWELSQNELVNTGLFVPNSGATFALQATVEKKLDNSPPTMSISGEITNFSVFLLPPPADLVSIDFDSVKFTAVNDEKVDVDVQLKTVEFRGILQFVNKLSEVIPLDGFSDPPSLEISQSPPGINVGFSFGIPTVGVGVMTIQNITLAAGFFLPFGSDPMNFHFAFCERQQPFILTVSLFGGGGFFAMDIGIEKVVMIEAALEFGASAAIDLGVASGEATMMAGFYFQKSGADFTLTGYFRAYGSLSVLGIITVSLEFYLGLTYESDKAKEHGGTLWGQAKLTVKIEILFFSTSVSVSMEREFAGSDPAFHQLVAPNVWTLYCEAFAPYP